MAESRIGQNVRTPEGHAAMSMTRSGPDDLRWVEIQNNTFLNWVNEQLNGTPMVTFERDFNDGVNLIALVEALQQKPIGRKVFKKPVNQHQRLENVTIALEAIRNDNVKLVNIGSEDIVDGNLKLILGLIWHLILRYQIGKTKFPPKKIMLAWLQSALPKCEISNFSSSWNDGVALHALIEYCSPGTFPDWQKLDKSKKLENCMRAMTTAKDKFDIPLVVRPEDMASHHLDELSGMTYLSYYMKQDSPGYYATLNRVRQLLERSINNFTTDWNDGELVCELVRAVGGQVSKTGGTNEEVLKTGLSAGKEMGFKQLMSAKEIAAEKEEHLGIMAYAAQFLDKKSMAPPAERVTMNANLKNAHVGNEATIHMNIVDKNISQKDIKVEVAGPDSKPPVHISWTGQSGVFTFVPVETGQHKLTVLCGGQEISGCPKTFKVNADRSKVSYLQIENCCVGTITEVKVNAVSAGQGNVKVEAKSPSGHVNNLPVMNQNGFYNANFTPTEVGDWKMSVYYDGEHISGSPFDVNVFDPAQVQIFGMDGGTVGKELKFKADCCHAGKGDLQVKIKYGDRDVPLHLIQEADGIYKVNFTPQGAGLYEIKGLFNDVEIKGSPYTLEIVDSNMVSVSGSGLEQVAVNKLASFNVNTKGAGGGDVKVEINAPDGQNIPVKVKDKGDKTYLVEWVPNMVGEHAISVNYAGVPVKGNPFSAKAYDTDKVIVSSMGQGILGKSVDFNLDASKAGAGNLEIFISVNGENVPNYVKQEPRDACFKVSFIPQQPYDHMVHVKFNGISVPGSPFPCKVLNTERVQVSGDALQLASANTLSSFKVDPVGSGIGELTVNITSPTGKSVPARIHGSSSSTYRVDFTPTEVGKHQIRLFYGDVEIKNSPFMCNVFDASRAKVKASKIIYLNRSSIIGVDTSSAGIGHLEAEVKCQGQLVHSTLREAGPGMYEVAFVPRNTATHLISLLFNDYPMPGSPLHMVVTDSSTISATGEGLGSAQSYKESTFAIDTHGDEDNLHVKVLCPSGRELPFKRVQRGKLSHIEFTPHEVGMHTIDVLIAEEHISGSPFHCNVFDPSSVRITDVDQGGKIEREINFTVDASAGGNGELEATVKHHGKVIGTKRQHLGNNRYRFMFTPEETGQYGIDVKFNNENIPGSPVVVQVEDDLPTFIAINFRGIKHINAMDLNWFLIELDGKKIDMKELQIIIRAPNGDLIPARMIPQHDGDYKVEWTPTIPGRYSIDVLFGMHQVQGSPFAVDVFDVKKVHVDGLHSSTVGEQADFVVDYSGAGRAEYAVKVLSPSGQAIPIHVQENNNKNEISYFPTEAGKYKIYVTYGGIDIPGTPLIQVIGEGGMPTAHGDGLHKGEEDKPATFYVDAAGLKGDLFVQVDGPNSIAKCNIDPEANGAYAVTYVPVEVGLYDVQVKWNNKEIQGSPFHPKVVDARKVRVVSGWQHFMDSDDRVHLVVDEVKKIPFDISEAGPGKLTAEVQDPNNDWLPVHIDTSSDGKNTLAFTPKVEGNHLINVYWTEHPLVGAPFLGYAVAKVPIPIPTTTHDNSQVTLSGRGLKEAVVREEAEFYIDGSRAGPGKPEVSLTGVRTEIEIFKNHLGDGRYHCTYTPVLPGGYLLHITWNNRQLKGSPYKVGVIAAAQPQKVNVSGEGLEGGILGKELQVNIDTRKAGPGELTAHCMGPTRTAYCELNDNHDGIYKLTVRPQEPGRHILQIKYGGENVLGSPYVLKIGAQPDASKVRVSGPGVEHGILATFQSHFLVETDGAGAGKLTVRIRGPKGAFQVHMSRESQRDRNIVCHYDPFETGLYIIQVKWSDKDVPGSSFHVQIVDTHQEYEAISQEGLHNGYTFSDSLPHRPQYNQWREDI